MHAHMYTHTNTPTHTEDTCKLIMEKEDNIRLDREEFKRTTKTGIFLPSAISAAKAIQQAVIPLPHEAIAGLSKLTPLDVKTGVFETILQKALNKLLCTELHVICIVYNIN